MFPGLLPVLLIKPAAPPPPPLPPVALEVVDLEIGLAASPALAQTVYLRQGWDDDWAEQPYLHCTSATWCCAPGIPTATLSWDYGLISQQDEVHPTEYFPSDWDTWYVRIVFECEPWTDAAGATHNTREWCGVIRFTEQRVAGDVLRGGDYLASGEIVLTAYGMEKLLAEKCLTTSVWRRDVDEWERAEVVFVFNPVRDGRPSGNRSPDEVDGAYVFSNDPEETDAWTNRNIADYLMRFHQPLDSVGGNSISFRLDAHWPIVEIEPGELDPTGQTVHSVICRLMDRRRLIVWWAEYDESSNDVLLKTATMTKTTLVLPIRGGPMIPANPNQRQLIATVDPATSWADRWPAIEPCDQVVVRGARRVSVGTFSFMEDTLEKSWSTADETAYQAAASGQPGYVALSTKVKQRRNAEARSRPELERVHSLFRIPQTWDGKVGDGFEDGPYKPLFPVTGSPNTVFPVNYRELTVQQHLPLKEGVEYDVDLSLATNLDESHATGRLLPPLIFFRVPPKQLAEGEQAPAERWILVNKLGVTAELEHTGKHENHRLTAHVQVPENYPGFSLRVTGQPQHAIALSFFEALEHDGLRVDPKVGEWDYAEGMIATLAVTDDRYVQGVYPDPAPSGIDAVRVKIIDAGDRYRKDYIAPLTIVSADEDGALLFNEFGGFLPPEATDDHEHTLAALAKIAWCWYGQRHHVVALDTYRITPQAALGLGNLIETIGCASTSANTLQVNSVITQIDLQCPKGLPRAGAAPRPTLQITTWAGELEADPLAPPALTSGGIAPYTGKSSQALGLKQQAILQSLRNTLRGRPTPNQ